MEIRWVTINRLSEITGYTIGALKQKVYQGIFVQGIHYRKSPDGRIHFDLKRYEEWVCQQE